LGPNGSHRTGLKEKGAEGTYHRETLLISTSRRTGFRRLHKKSCACGVMYWTVASCEEVELVPKAGVDAWCRVCFRAELDEQEEDDSSTSGSSTSTEEER
jgi:hypothetical protein